MDRGQTEAASSVPRVETARPRYSRDQVIKALRDGVSRFQQFAQSDQASTRDKWYFNKALKPALDKTLDRTDGAGNPDPRDSYTNSFVNPKTDETFTQEEGIPTERVIEHLQDLLTKAKGVEAKKIKRTLDVLQASSRKYEDAHKANPDDPDTSALNMNDAQDTRLEARKAQEANFILNDERRPQNIDVSSHQGQDLIWYDATDTLKGRMELNIPPARVRVRNTTPAAAAPATPTIIERVSGEGQQGIDGGGEEGGAEPVNPPAVASARASEGPGLAAAGPTGEAGEEPAKTPEELLNETDPEKPHEAQLTVKPGDSFKIQIDEQNPDRLQLVLNQTDTDNVGSMSILVNPDDAQGNTIYINTNRRTANGDRSAGTSLYDDEFAQQLAQRPYKVQLTPNVAVEITDYDPATGRMTIRRVLPEDEAVPQTPEAQLNQMTLNLAQATSQRYLRNGVDVPVEEINARLQQDLEQELTTYQEQNPGTTREDAIANALRVRQEQAQTQRQAFVEASQNISAANVRVQELARLITPDMDPAERQRIEDEIAQVSREAERQLNQTYVELIIPGLAEMSNMTPDEYRTYIDSLAQRRDRDAVNAALIRDAVNLGVGIAGEIGNDPRLEVIQTLDQAELDRVNGLWNRVAPALANLRLMNPDQLNTFIENQAQALGVTPDQIRYLLLTSAQEAGLVRTSGGEALGEIDANVSPITNGEADQALTAVPELQIENNGTPDAQATVPDLVLPGAPIVMADTLVPATTTIASSTTGPGSTAAPGNLPGGTSTGPNALPATPVGTTNVNSNVAANNNTGQRQLANPDNQNQGNQGTGANGNPEPGTERFDINVISAQDMASGKAYLEAQRGVTTELRRHAWWKLWRWPKKIIFRAVESGLVNQRKDRLLRVMAENNSTFMKNDTLSRGAGEINAARATGKVEFNALIDRFRSGHTVSGERVVELTANTQDQSQRALRNEIMNGIIKRMIDSPDVPQDQKITSPDQVRVALADFCRTHANDSLVRELFGANVSEFGDRTEIFANNVWEVGQQIKGAMARHNRTLEQMDEQITIRLGRAAGLATDVRGFVDKRVAAAKRLQEENLVRRLEGRANLALGAMGVILNPATVGIGVALGTDALMRSISTLARVATPFSFLAGGIAGGVVGGVRRYHEVGRDRAYYMARRGQGEKAPDYQRPAGLRGRIARLAGAERMQDLEKRAYQMVTVDQLQRGDTPGAAAETNRDVVTGVARLSMDALRALDLSDPLDGERNRQAVASRVAEIEFRLDQRMAQRSEFIDFGSEEAMAVMPTELYREVAQLRANLRSVVTNDSDWTALMNTATSAWRTKIETDKAAKDASFQTYRLKQAVGAGVFAGAAGLTAGAAVRAARLLINGDFAGTTFAEAGRKIVGLSSNSLDTHELYKHSGGSIPKDVPLSQDTHLQIGEGHTAALYDATGNRIDTPPMKLLPTGVGVTISAEDAQKHVNPLDKLPANIKNLLSVWEQRPTKDPVVNLDEHLRQLADSGKHETFTQGNLIIDVNSNLDPNANPGGVVESGVHRFSVTLYQGNNPDGTPMGPRIDGYLDSVGGSPVLNLDSSIGNNAAILANPATAGVLQNEFLHNGWKVEMSGSPLRTVTVNTVDQFFQKTPEQMRKEGVIDITQMPHDPRYDTLRPDIVARTGNYTHNELTFHVAKFRNFPGQPGHISATGQIRGGLIPSHLEGVPAQADPALDQINRLLGGQMGKKLEWKDMVFLVRTSNGHELTIPMAPDGSAQLPPEFYKVMPDGSVVYRGIGRMGYGVLQSGPNGPAILADGLPTADALASKGKFVTRWLASEEFGGKDATDTIEIPGDQVVKLTPPVALEFRPPETTDWLVPIPFAPRHPLPEMARRRIPDRIPTYGGYNFYEDLASMPEDRREFYRTRTSERLRANPDVNLQAEVEIPEYFANMTPEYRQELQNYLDQEGMRAPMDNRTDALVCVPVYDLGEGQVVQGALEQYLLQIDKTRNKQAIDPRKFELVLFLNHPKGIRQELETQLGRGYAEGAEARVLSGNPEAYDTREVIKQFMLAHPELRVRIMETEFDTRPPWGQIIKPLYDAALLKASQRANPVNADPIIITNDIDVVDMSPTYMRDILQTIDLNNLESSRDPSVRKIDGLAGKTDMPNKGYETLPGFLAAMRLYQFLDNQLHNDPNRVVITQGRNTVLRGSTYAAIGGVNPNTDAGGDTELGRMVAMMRNNPNTIEYNNGIWLNTDPRREVGMWSKGIPLAFAWDEWSAMNVYGKDWKDRFNVPPQDPSRIDKDFLQREVNTEVQRWGISPDSREMRRALAFLGFKPADYHLENGQIILDNIAGVSSNLQQFIAEKRWQKSDEKKQEALKRPPVANFIPTYSAEYMDYEEVDRIYADIFFSREYPWQPDASNPSPKIIDLGGHIGMSVLYWKSLAPGAQITAVEANPDTYKVLNRNVQRNRLSGVTTRNAAASETGGTVPMHMAKPGTDFHWGDFAGGRPVDPSKYDTVNVPAVKLSSLINGPIDLLKVDIEGSETEVLREAEPKLSQVKEIMVEFHVDPANPTNSLRETLDILRRQGFTPEVRRYNQPINENDVDPSTLDYLTILANRTGTPYPVNMPSLTAAVAAPATIATTSLPNRLPPSGVLASTITSPLRTTVGTLGAVTAPLASAAGSVLRSGGVALGTAAIRLSSSAASRRTSPPTPRLSQRRGGSPTPSSDTTAVPDIVTVPTETVPVIISTDAEVDREGGLVESINEQLATATSNSVRLEYSPQVVSEYLGSIDLGSGSHLIGINTARQPDGRLAASGVIDIPGRGRLPFTLQFENNPDTGLLQIMPGYNVDYSQITNVLVRGAIQGRVNSGFNNLNQTVTNRLNREVGADWEVGGISIDGDNLAFDVTRTNVSITAPRPAPVPSLAGGSSLTPSTGPSRLGAAEATVRAVSGRVATGTSRVARNAVGTVSGAARGVVSRLSSLRVTPDIPTPPPDLGSPQLTADRAIDPNRPLFNLNGEPVQVLGINPDGSVAIRTPEGFIGNVQRTTLADTAPDQWPGGVGKVNIGDTVTLQDGSQVVVLDNSDPANLRVQDLVTGLTRQPFRMSVVSTNAVVQAPTGIVPTGARFTTTRNLQPLPTSPVLRQNSPQQGVRAGGRNVINLGQQGVQAAKRVNINIPTPNLAGAGTQIGRIVRGAAARVSRVDVQAGLNRTAQVARIIGGAAATGLQEGVTRARDSVRSRVDTPSPLPPAPDIGEQARRQEAVELVVDWHSMDRSNPDSVRALNERADQFLNLDSADTEQDRTRKIDDMVARLVDTRNMTPDEAMAFTSEVAIRNIAQLTGLTVEEVLQRVRARAGSGATS